MKSRGSGILLHITSLFSPYGIGDLGPGAYRLADFLQQTRQRFWQVLPLNPTDSAFGNSPYSSISAFAGDPLLISPEFMLQDGFLTPKDVRPPDPFPHHKVAYSQVRQYKEEILDLAYQRFKSSKEGPDYESFCKENTSWLEDFVLFKALKAHYGGRAWNEWPERLRDRQPRPLQEAGKALTESMERERFLQYLFFKQWFSLKRYCNQRGIRIIGDLPIYVNLDSVDVWQHPEIFKLDEKRHPSFVAGVPPDYFSSTGQLWGNPVYNWDALKESGYAWWIRRFEHMFRLFDIVRIDHFRGLIAYWEVPAHEKTAVNGGWVSVSAEDFFNTLKGHFDHLPIIAEDLGSITPDVREIKERFQFPGMKVLLFAFNEDHPMHPYLPHTYERECVVYTGTHDNNTIRGWLEREAKPDGIRRVFRYLGREVPIGEIHWELIRLAMMSVGNAVILPMQDVLGLGDEARMNRPATSDGNWEWRLSEEQLNPSLAAKLLEMTVSYGRASPSE